MAMHLEAGAPFKLVGGQLCLDFINTVSGRLPDPRAAGRDYADVVETEWLVTFRDLARWGRLAQAVRPEEAGALDRAALAAPAKARRVVARAQALREALYRLFKAATETWEPDARDLEVLDRELARSRANEHLAARGSRLAWRWDPGVSLDRVLWPVARSAAELLTAGDLSRVRQCDGEACGWLFHDSSRNRGRRWCDMSDCGNVAKVRRFRRRH